MIALPLQDKKPMRSDCVLSARGVRKRYGGHEVLRGVDLELRRGDVVLLQGDNGSGKTTLLNILAGGIRPDEGELHYGEQCFRFPDRGLRGRAFSSRSLAKVGVSRTWQNVRLFGSQTVAENVVVSAPRQKGEFPPSVFLLNRKVRTQDAEIASMAARSLVRLGLGAEMDRLASRISLGQSKRVAIARAIMSGARILFLDEPLAGLDSAGTREVVAYLTELTHTQDLTLVIVEHYANQHHLADLVSTTWRLESGQLLPRDSQPRVAGHATRPAWFSDLARGDEVTESALAGHAVVTRIRREAFQEGAEPVLDVQNLVVKRGNRTVVGLNDEGQEEGLSIALRPGEIVLLQAANGWGKSSLFDAITGLLPWHAGDIQLTGQSLNGCPAWRRTQMGLRSMPSAGDGFHNLTGDEFLRLANVTSQLPDSRYTIGALGSRRIGSMSGGERQRIALLSAVAHQNSSSLIVLDEPFSALDLYATQKLIKILLLQAAQVPILVLQPRNN